MLPTITSTACQVRSVPTHGTSFNPPAEMKPTRMPVRMTAEAWPMKPAAENMPKARARLSGGKLSRIRE